MNYTNLDIGHKRAFLMNLKSLASYSSILAKEKGGTREEWAEAMLDASQKFIDNLSDAEVERYITDIEYHHVHIGGVFEIKKND